MTQGTLRCLCSPIAASPDAVSTRPRSAPPSSDIASHHLLVAAAAQNYGQNSCRIRQPFDFAKRTGKIVFDAAVNKLTPLHGWVSLAITEDPMSAPGYAILGNDEGSIIPRNAIEVHFANWGDETRISGRNIHIFKDHVDTVYQPPQAPTAPAFKPGKLNRYEFLVSEHSVEVHVTAYSEDGVTWAPSRCCTSPMSTLRRSWAPASPSRPGSISRPWSFRRRTSCGARE